MISAITLGDENPNARNRAWWGALLALFGMLSLRLEEFSAIESLSVTMALPFSLFLLLVLYGSYVVARDYVREGEDEMPQSDPQTSRPQSADHGVPDDD